MSLHVIAAEARDLGRRPGERMDPILKFDTHTAYFVAHAALEASAGNVDGNTRFVVNDAWGAVARQEVAALLDSTHLHDKAAN